MKNYPYLKDLSFLNQLYKQHNKTVYVRVTVLDWSERFVSEVQGKIISGSISINGDSVVRRTANLSVHIKDESEIYNNPDSLFAINKKIFLETGLVNNFTNSYSEDFPIIWFPHGIFIIQSFSISHDNTGVTVSLSLGDKMSLLNGDSGGVIPASVNFESMDDVGPDGGMHSTWVQVNQIIPELVNHFGGEDLTKIIVNDVPDRLKQVLKWHGNENLYLFEAKLDNTDKFFSTINPAGNSDIERDYNITPIPYNYDAGYCYPKFTYPGELTAGAGDTVCTVLDKIKNILGNYEYFYDSFGNFIFQEKKNYINMSQWSTLYQAAVLNHSEDLPYTYTAFPNSSVYQFNDSELILNYSNAPKLNMIKNDFIVWGSRTNSEKIKLPCRYHLAIDTKPQLLEPLVLGDICFETSMYDKIRRCHKIKGKYESLEALQKDVPNGIIGEYYGVKQSPNEDTYNVYTWVTDVESFNSAQEAYESSGQDSSKLLSTVTTDTNATSGYVQIKNATYFLNNTFVVPINTDWRNILYFQGIQAEINGTDTGYYWAELCNEWPKIYDVEHDEWYEEALKDPTSLDWWLDFIDNDSLLNQFSVDVIGRRSYAKTDTECNCVFEPIIPDIFIVDTTKDEDLDSKSSLTQGELKELGLTLVQINPGLSPGLVVGGTFNSCYQHIRQLITDYTNYNETINITCLPIYHLEPNTRVFFNDPVSGIYGDYIINTISFNLGNNGTMNISAQRCIEKI
jgi:hypothetical protein